MKLIAKILLLLALISCQMENRVPVYLIPDGFTGKIQINFDVNTGSLPDFSDKFVIYNVPASGILNTQTQSFVRLSHVAPIFYYVDSEGNRVKKIPYTFIPIHLNDKNELRVFNHSFGEDESKNYNAFEVYVLDTVSNLSKYPKVLDVQKRFESIR
jgi:hypothetical protein